ncbi:hypothetical protein [Dyella subtropica]|uniref:hypothetical protein n=1 Tax=Dyella subtropica TaxID=2992127 RepID=UPI00225B30AD|nr:hypothetical protein [Dyella subtropica]
MLGGWGVWTALRRRQGSASLSDSAVPITIGLGSLQLTLLHRHAPVASNAWCRNALMADARCVVEQGELHAKGALLSAVDLQAWCGKLPAFLAGCHTELHLCSDGDCVSLYLHRPLRGDMTAVTVVLVDPQAYAVQDRLSAECRERHSLLFLVTHGQLERFGAQVEQAMRGFPVYLGHAAHQPA